ncbi:hypothetical protein BDZ94DRAFT_1310581 [Collybia nuda]|uniref:F-box domain-containing protein n=1 Tax=Collybia nuda TaxID=64659 RepID=A0A9P5Y599_9AGAR|nr:hypothetical protein BDZ94DRAFT_1310581 [Collybia nuda]
MTPTLIPQDIVNEIVEKIKSDKKALKKVSLISRSFCDPCRKHLFARLELDCRRVKRIKAFHRILTLNPDLAHNPRYLNLIIYEGSNDKVLPLILRALNNLRSISWQVPQAEPLSWTAFQPSLKTALIERLQAPGLSNIDISHVTGFPLSLFSVCTDLKKLTLTDIFSPTCIYHEVSLEENVRPKAWLQSLSISSTFNADHSFARVFTHLLTSVEISQLRQLHVGSVRRDDEILECQKVIEASAYSLKELTLIVKFTFMTPQRAFDLNSVTSLRRLTIKMAQNPRMLEWLQSILLSANNSLEHVKLSLFDQLVAEENQSVLTKLTDIDDTLADPRFENLRSVSLAFDSWMSRPILGSSFTEQCMPKLASKEILCVYWNNKPLFFVKTTS